MLTDEDGRTTLSRHPLSERPCPCVALRFRSNEGTFSMVLTMTPQPISNSPQDHDQPFLLFCPEQGGWHIGIWFLGKWLAYIDTSTVLEPSHWSPVPPDPPDVEDPLP